MNVCITGASNGIGYHCCVEFCKRSKTTIIALSRNKEKLLGLKQEAEQYNESRVLIYPVDLEKLDGDHFRNFLSEHLVSAIDILINNAGLLIKKPFAKLDAADWGRIYSVNVFSVARMIQLLLPLMNRKQRGHIVNISSMGGIQGSVKFPELSAYSSSKAALINMTECLAEEFKTENISFNTLALGAVQTEMLQKAFPGYVPPLTPKEMAEWITDFAMKGQHFFNGKILQVAQSTP